MIKILRLAILNSCQITLAFQKVKRQWWNLRIMIKLKYRHQNNSLYMIQRFLPFNSIYLIKIDKTFLKTLLSKFITTLSKFACFPLRHRMNKEIWYWMIAKLFRCNSMFKICKSAIFVNICGYCVIGGQDKNWSKATMKFNHIFILVV